VRSQIVVVEWFYADGKWTEEQVDLAHGRVEALAHQLSVKEKPKGLPVLNCIGWIQHPHKKDRALLYAVPEEIASGGAPSQPISLYEHLVEARTSEGTVTTPTLADRFQLADALAVGVLEIHLVEWLHKNLGSHSILLFRDDNGRVKYSRPFIVGFDFARPDKQEQKSLPMRMSQFDIYRHPEIRALQRASADLTGMQALYAWRHDIWSLGLILFEIGLWKRLETYSTPNLTPENFKKRILDYVGRELSLWMGTRYRQAVDACLTGEYAKETDAVPLDLTLERYDDDTGNDENNENNEREGHSLEELNTAEMGRFCRSVIGELSVCHCGMGGITH
jgi:serine/threonine protein kinase